MRGCRSCGRPSIPTGSSWGSTCCSSSRLTTQRAVEDEAVALVVVADGAALVGVVVRPLDDRATVGLDRLRRPVDIRGLDADDHMARERMIDLGRQRQRDRAAVERSVMRAVTELQLHPEGLAVEADRFIEVVRRQDDHANVVITHWWLLCPLARSYQDP